MPIVDLNLFSIASGVRDTLKLRYSVLLTLYCVQQDHKGFLVQLQFQRPLLQPQPQSLHPHQVRQPQYKPSLRNRLDKDILLELLPDALFRHIGQRFDLLNLFMVTKSCLTYANTPTLTTVKVTNN